MSARALEIRPMRPGDRQSTSEMLGQITREGRWWQFAKTSTDDQVMELWQAIGDVFIAEVEGEARGTFVIGAQHYTGAHIASCGYAVASNSRGQGLADALCKASIREAAHRGYRAIQLNSVLVNNTSAVHVYERNGFETVGRVPEGFLDPTGEFIDVLIMYRRV